MYSDVDFRSPRSCAWSESEYPNSDGGLILGYINALSRGIITKLTKGVDRVKHYRCMESLNLVN